MAASSAIAENGGFRLLGDQPALTGADALGFDTMADELARIVLTSRHTTPFTIGIEADWGMGKSTLMQRVRARLDSAADQGVTTVWFNAWTSDQGEVLEGLIKTVLDRVDPDVLRKALRDDRIKAALRIGSKVAGRVVHMGDVVDEIWNSISDDPRARNEMRALMEKAMAEWAQSGRGASERRLVVVFIDDLDRCSPRNVFQVFEAIKLYLDAPGFVFVVGYDQTAVSDAILHEKGYSKNVKSTDYIEKIVQTVYRIRAPGDDEAQQLIEECLEASGTEGIFDAAAATLVIDHNARNPRRIKRFINAFILEYARDPEWRDDPQLGAGALVGVLILYTYFPEFAQLLTDRNAPDPIAEFQEYLGVRAGCLAPPDEETPEWRSLQAAFRAHGLAPPRERAECKESLEAYEAELPELFPSLVKNGEFIALLTSFRDEALRAELRAKLQRRPPVRATPADRVSEADAAFAASDATSLRGLKIVWINDDPSSDEPYVHMLKEAGAQVAQTTSSPQARELLRSADVFISDISRPGDDNAGLNDLKEFRDSGTYLGPAIFFTSRVTQSRRAQAAALDAEITSNGTEFLALVQEAARKLASPKETVPS